MGFLNNIEHPFFALDTNEVSTRHLLHDLFDGQRLAGTHLPSQQHGLAAPQAIVDQLRLLPDKAAEATQSRYGD